MAGVFDRLQKNIEDKQKEGGITALDLADLPPVLRKIMRLMLRQLQMTYPELCEAMENMPEDQRLSTSDLDEALKTLSEQGWLIQIGEGKKAVYKVNLRRKAGSTLASGIWSELDAKLKNKPDS
jgi:vacuolar-type H+-ATPase subunit E/Vma4